MVVLQARLGSPRPGIPFGKRESTAGWLGSRQAQFAALYNLTTAPKEHGNVNSFPFRKF